MKERIIWIDYSKVILICLVVFAHSPFVPTYLDTFICGFHMPAFFIISGYLHKPSSNINSCIKRNIRRLIIPALAFSFICYLLWLIKQFVFINNISANEILLKPLLGLFLYDNNYANPMCGVIWFLVVLFVCFIVLDLIVKLYKTKGLLISSLGCIVLVIIQNSFNYKDFMYGFYFQRAIISFPYVAFGYFCHDKNILVKSTKKNHLILYGIILFVVYLFLVLINGRVGIYSCSFGKSVILYYITSVVGSLALFNLMAIRKTSNFLIKKISSGTIVILCIHQVMIKIFVHIWNNPYFITVAIITICYPIICFLNKYAPWIVGRTKIYKKAD